MAACCADGISRIQDAAELRVKETDRLAVMARQLGAMGARIQEFEDGMAVTGGVGLPVGVVVDPLSAHGTSGWGEIWTL